MRRLFPIASFLVALPLTLAANDFDWLVREFARESGAHRMHIPMFGLVRFAVAVGHPAGASQLNLAVFEHANLESSRFSALTDDVAGGLWKPMIRVRSKNGESTNIYAQANGKDLRLLVTSLDKDEATFLELKIWPESLIKFVDDHRRAH